MEPYLIPAVCLVAAWVVQVRRNRTIDRTMLGFTTVAIILVAGLRWYSDVDYGLYVEMYHDNPTLSQFGPSTIDRLYGEPGYLFITAIFKSLDIGFHWLAFLAVVIGVAIKALVLSRVCRHASLALGMYLCFHFITIEFIQLRWAMATALIALAFYYQYRREYLLTALWFTLSISLHYFTLVFVLLSLALPWFRRERTLYALMGLGLVLAFVLQNDVLAPLLISDSQIYLLSRISRYAQANTAPLGAFSFLKLGMYVAIYAGCARMRRSFDWSGDPLNSFLVRVSFLSIALTLALTFQPILHYRATVVADFFGIILVLNAISVTFEWRIRAAVLASLVGLFGTWYALDLRNNIEGDKLFDYQTWLGAT